MTLITTAGSLSADSYVTIDDCTAYAAAMGLSWVTTDTVACEAALRKATAYIDATYRLRFTGYRTYRRNQALEWPRTGAYVYIPNNASDQAYAGGYDPAYDYLATTEIPTEIKKATCEAAIRELAVPGTLNPDLERGGSVKRIKADTVEIEYGANATPITVFTAIDKALSGLLRQVTSYGVRAVRG